MVSASTSEIVIGHTCIPNLFLNQGIQLIQSFIGTSSSHELLLAIETQY